MEFIAIIAFIFLLLFMQNSLYRRYGFYRLDYKCYFNTDRATEGDEIEIIEEISNGKWLPLAWFKTEITTSKWLEFAGAQSEITDQSRFVPSFFMLKSYHRVVRRWHVKCLKRGRYKIDSVTLVSTDLFGNVTLSRQGTATGRLIVLPKPVTKEQFTSNPRYFTGDIVVKRHHVVDPFVISGIREYSGGESFREVHWAATAKENRLMVYQKDSTTDQNLAVILNLQSREMQYIASVDRLFVELCIKVAAGVLTQALAAGLPVRFYCNTSFDKSRNTIVSGESRGVAHTENLLELLALLPNDSTEKFPVYLQNISAKVDATDIIIVTSYVDEAMQNFAMQKRFNGKNTKILSLSDAPFDCDFVLSLSHLRDEFYNRPSGEEA